MERMDHTAQSEWARKLNEYGLLSCIADATTFRAFFYAERGRRPEGEMEGGTFDVLEIARLRAAPATAEADPGSEQ
jgi:hypothetical protein